MAIKLNPKAYQVGDYNSNLRILNVLEPTNETSIYENIFNVKLVNSQNKEVAIQLQSVTRKAQAPTQLLFKIKIQEDVENGKFIFMNRNNGLLRGNNSPDNIFFDDAFIPEITATKDSVGQTLENINSFAGPTMRSVTTLTMLTSFSSSVALIKIFQMMDYMLFFNVGFPPIFGKYLEIFSTDFFNNFPNVLIMFVDEKCPVIKEKFLDEDMSCQFLSNCGSIIFIMILTFILKIGLLMAKTAVTNEQKLMGNLRIIITKINSIFGYEFYLNLLDMFQLDFYLAIFLQLDNMKIMSSKSFINIAISIICLISFMFIKLLVFFYSTRVANIKKNERRTEKGYKKYYYNFLFLGEGVNHDSFYSNNQLILNMLKDPVLGFALVFFYDTPILQVGTAFFITVVYFLMEVICKPSINNWENKKNILSFAMYSVSNGIFLTLILIGSSLSLNKKDLIFGWSLVVCNTTLILFNYVCSFRETYLMLKKKWKDKKLNQIQKKKNDSAEITHSQNQTQESSKITITHSKVKNGRKQALSRRLKNIKIKNRKSINKKDPSKLKNIKKIAQNLDDSDIFEFKKEDVAWTEKKDNALYSTTGINRRLMNFSGRSITVSQGINKRKKRGVNKKLRKIL